MRTDQWVGLTSDAEKYVKGLEVIEEDRYVLGMFENKLPLRTWKKPITYPSGDKGKDMIIREILQASPWSSGPMYFTQIELDYQNGGIIKCYEWVADPMLYGLSEFDQETGKYWV